MEEGVIFSNENGVFKKLPNGVVVPYKNKYAITGKSKRDNKQRGPSEQANRIIQGYF